MDRRTSRIFTDICNQLLSAPTPEQEDFILQCLEDEYERLKRGMPHGIAPKFWCTTLINAFMWSGSVRGRGFWVGIHSGYIPGKW